MQRHNTIWNMCKTQHNSPVNTMWWSFHLGILNRGEYWTSAEPTALLLLLLTYSGMHKKLWNPTSNPIVGFPQDYRKTPEKASQLHLSKWLNPAEISEGKNLIQGYHKARITIRQTLTYIHFPLSVSQQIQFGGTRLLWILSALFLKTAELVPNAAWFPWQSFCYIIFISPRSSWKEKLQREEKKTKPPLELSKTLKLCLSFTSLLENSREQKCRLRRSHYSVGSRNFFTWHEKEWRGLKWVLMYKDINSYSKFWVPAHYTELPYHLLHQRVCSAALKRKWPTKLLAPCEVEGDDSLNTCSQELLPRNSPGAQWRKNFGHLSSDHAALNILQGNKVHSAPPSDVLTTTLILRNK